MPDAERSGLGIVRPTRDRSGRGFLIRDLMLAVVGLAVALRLVVSATTPVYREGWIIARLSVKGPIVPPFGSSRSPVEGQEAHVRRMIAPDVLGAAERLPGGSAIAGRLFASCDVKTSSVFLYLQSSEPSRDRPIVDALAEAYARVSGARIAHRATNLQDTYPLAGFKLAGAILAAGLGLAPGAWRLVRRRLRGGSSTDRPRGDA